MGHQNQIAKRASGTREHEPSRAIFREVRNRGGLINLAFNQPCRTCQTSALMADGGQRDTGSGSRVPNKFVRFAMDGSASVRRFENHHHL